MSEIRKALMERARLLGEGLSGGAKMRGYSLTGGMRKAKGITGGMRKAKGITGGKRQMKPCKAPQAPKTNRCKKQRGAKKGAIPPQLERWLNLVQDVRTENPRLSYKQALQRAKTIYRNM